MFVAASLRAGSHPLEVRVRNMSRQGALVEGAVLPPVGTSVELVRGHLRARGRVAWVAGHRCGLALDDLVDTQAWMSRAPPAHQAEVDAKLAEARRAMAASPATAAALVEPDRGFVQSLATPQDELRATMGRLDALGEQLVADPDVVTRHPTALQILDEVQQRLTALAARLR